jgi:hypothetical protein
MPLYIYIKRIKISTKDAIILSNIFIFLLFMRLIYKVQLDVFHNVQKKGFIDLARAIIVIDNIPFS